MISRFVAVSLIAFVLAGCATTKGGGYSSTGAKKNVFLTDGARTVSVRAVSLIYSVAPTPTVTEKKFNSSLDINNRSEVMSFNFKNRFADEKANTRVLVAISGRTAGFNVYDHLDKPLAEYAKGKVMGSTAEFRDKTKNGSTRTLWVFGENTAVSVIESYDKNDVLIYAEVTTYTPAE